MRQILGENRFRSPQNEICPAFTPDADTSSSRPAQTGPELTFVRQQPPSTGVV